MVLNIKFIKKLKNNPKDLDKTIASIHQEIFDKTDCLACANCCKTTSPIFRNKDIDRISAHLHLKPAKFIEKYLHVDEDGHYVLNIAPCPFLLDDKRCDIYVQRPAACREYPHTNRKRFYQIVDLTVKNAEICPAVETILEKLESHYH